MSPTSFPRFLEILPAGLLAGAGMILAGGYVDWLKHTNANQLDTHFLAIIPPLIGLKGNLEVALSSHLATVFNLRSIADPQPVLFFLPILMHTLLQGVFGALLISFLGAAICLPQATFDQTLYLITNLSTVSTLTCILAICTLSILVFGLTSCCQFLGIDPDNVVPPVAAALGDLTTVTLLFHISQCYMKFPLVNLTLALLSAALIFSATLFYFSTQSHPNVCDMQSLEVSWGTLLSSAVPLSCAVVISSLSGQVFARFAHRLHNLARLQIAVNGVGGCFGSIVISRMVTRIHAKQRKYTSPAPSRKLGESESSESTPSCSTVPSADVRHVSLEASNLLIHQTVADASIDAYQTGKLVLLMCIPLHAILVLISFSLPVFMQSDRSHLAASFGWETAGVYLLASFLQTFAVLHFAKWIVLTVWRKLAFEQRQSICNPIKPIFSYQRSLASLDLTAIALTTSFGDLVGSILLTAGLAWLQN